jgi:hypothetical protein
MLALNLVDRSGPELLERLDMNQAAPAGFLALSKIIASPFDYTELALYFVPLVFGVAALVLFIPLSVAVLGPERAPLAFLPMATCSTAIFYCGEFKPQSTDLFFTVLIVFAAHTVVARRWASSAILAFAFASVIAVWFSYAVVFVLVGSGGALVILGLRSGRPRQSRIMVGAFAVAVGHFLALYLLHIRPSIDVDLFDANAASFAPVAADASTRWWWWLAWSGTFEFPLGFWGLTLVPMAALVAGAVVMGLDRRSRAGGLILSAPIVLLVVASGLGRYPIATGVHEVKSRFVIFTVPILLLIIARGAGWLWEVTGRRRWIAALLIAALVLPNLYGGVAGPRFAPQEMRPLTRHLQQHVRKGDTVYVLYSSRPAFDFYTRNRPIGTVVYGAAPRHGMADLVADLERVRHADRLWVVTSHAYRGERRVLRRTLATMGRRLETYRFPGARLGLYQLGQPAKDSG